MKKATKTKTKTNAETKKCEYCAGLEKSGWGASGYTLCNFCYNDTWAIFSGKAK